MKDESFAAVKRDVLVSTTFILLGILAIIKINMGKTGKVVETATLTHATLPTIYGALLIFLAGIILLGALRKLVTGRRGSAPERVNPLSEGVNADVTRGMVFLRTWGTLGLLIAYAFLLAYVNFIALTAAFLASLFVLFGRRKPWWIATASILGSLGFYLLFIHFLNLPI